MRFAPFRIIRACLATAALFLLVGCQGVLDLEARENAPVPAKLIAKMKARDMSPSAPIMMRVFKEEDVLEVWKQKRNGTYALLESFEICKWSGKFGPKKKEGDRQAPEGFYDINKWQMNPRSSYYLAFNIGFPNAYDRAHDRTGTHLMVHGACSSAGCYSMTDEHVQVIYALARDAFAGGQERFQFQAFPFRMTPKNMAEHRDHEHYPFWQMLKRGYDHFELTKAPPKVDVCEKRYVFNTEAEKAYRSREECPAMTMPKALADRYVTMQKKEADLFAKAVPSKERARLPKVTYASVLGPIAVEGAPAKDEPAAVPEAAPEEAPAEAVDPVTTSSIDKPRAANPLTDG